MPRSEEAQHAYNVRRRVQRCANRIDPRLCVGMCDGELFEGPTLDVWYRRMVTRDGCCYVAHDDTIDEDEQRARLMAVFQALQRRGLPVKYADQDSGAHFPCIEVALDEEHHNHVLATIARGVYDQGAEAMMPLVKHLGLRL